MNKNIWTLYGHRLFLWGFSLSSFYLVSHLNSKNMKKKYLITTLFILAIALSNRVHSQSLPYPALIGYWQNWSSTSLTAIDSRYNVIEVAFPLAQSGTDYNISNLSFGPHSFSTFKSAIQTLQGQGKKVLLSLGGASQPIYLNDVNEKNTFVSSVGNLLDTYGFDGIDIDLESSSLAFSTIKMTNNTDAGLVNMIAGIQEILANYQTTHSKRCLLTMAPEVIYVQGGYQYNNSRSGAYLPIIDALRNDIDMLQVQLYNVGDYIKALDGKTYTEGTADFIVAMTEMVIRGFTASKLSGGSAAFAGLPAHKVAVGLPSCSNSASGYVNATVRQQAIDYLRGVGVKPGTYALLTPGGHPTLGGIMTWSINEDKVCNPSYGIASSFQTIFAGVGNAIEDHTVNSLSIYPNPTDGIFKIETISVNPNASFILYNPLGQIIYRENINGNSSTSFDFSFLEGGLYVVQIGQETRKLLIR